MKRINLVWLIFLIGITVNANKPEKNGKPFGLCHYKVDGGNMFTTTIGDEMDGFSGYVDVQEGQKYSPFFSGKNVEFNNTNYLFHLYYQKYQLTIFIRTKDSLQRLFETESYFWSAPVQAVSSVRAENVIEAQLRLSLHKFNVKYRTKDGEDLIISCQLIPGYFSL